MKPGEIFIGRFPFGDVPGMKLRPLLALTPPIGPVPEVLAAYISSIMPSVLLPSDLVIDPRLPQDASTNIKQRSVIRLHKLATVHEQSLVRFVGKLSAAALQHVEDKLRKLLAL